MRELIHNMQARAGHWVGSSVVHLGDHNVPNALVFIDKYTQVSRILLPINACLTNIESMMDTPATSKYIAAKWSTAAELKQAILLDFFRHAFDGSGADNFYDAGSCIDGRLTSAWYVHRSGYRKSHIIWLCAFAESMSTARVKLFYPNSNSKMDTLTTYFIIKC